MAADRFIHLPDHDPVTFPTALERVVRDFFGQGATSIRWEGDRWFVTLPGKPSDALASTPYRHYVREDTRWIEVWYDDARDLAAGEPFSIDVMTRSQDQYTNALAEGLTQCLTTAFQGEREEE